MKIFCITEINDGEKMSKTLNKYIIALNYAKKAVLVLSVASGGISLWCFTTVIGTPVNIAITIADIVDTALAIYWSSISYH